MGCAPSKEAQRLAATKLLFGDEAEAMERENPGEGAYAAKQQEEMRCVYGVDVPLNFFLGDQNQAVQLQKRAGIIEAELAAIKEKLTKLELIRINVVVSDGTTIEEAVHGGETPLGLKVRLHEAQPMTVPPPIAARLLLGGNLTPILTLTPTLTANLTLIACHRN